ncbi:MAG: protein kinase [Eubacterium sp.]|nr:protein kinase [Eubacterium sp.]
MYSWLIKNITDGFVFSGNIKRGELGEVNIYKHKTTGQRIIVRDIKDGVEVYEKLLHIKSQHLPTIYEVVRKEPNTKDSEAIVVEEFISGITVGNVLESEHYNEKGVKVIVKALCDALEVLHNNGIVHRDIKPENIIIDDSGKVYLIDFNASRINKGDVAKDTRILGTSGFAAPEQYGISESDARTDIYSLGVLMNVMLTGDHPSKNMYKGKLKKVIKKCINTNPDDRFQNVEDLKMVL